MSSIVILTATMNGGISSIKDPFLFKGNGSVAPGNASEILGKVFHHHSEGENVGTAKGSTTERSPLIRTLTGKNYC